jgi:hypothetical protein
VHSGSSGCCLEAEHSAAAVARFAGFSLISLIFDLWVRFVAGKSKVRPRRVWICDHIMHTAISKLARYIRVLVCIRIGLGRVAHFAQHRLYFLANAFQATDFGTCSQPDVAAED